MRGGVHNQEWFCQKYEDPGPTGPFLAPGLIVLLLALPLAIIIYKATTSRGGECYTVKRKAPNKPIPATKANKKVAPAPEDNEEESIS